MNRFFKIVRIITVVMIPSIFITHYLKLSNVKFISSEFLLGYLGIFLGFSFSILTLVISVIDKVKQAIDPTYTFEEKEETSVRITNFVNEQFDMLFFLLYSFVFVVVIMVFEVVNINDSLKLLGVNGLDRHFLFAHYCEKLNPILTKVNLLNAAKLSIFSLSIFGIYDLLIGTFKFYIKSANIIDREKK